MTIYQKSNKVQLTISLILFLTFNVVLAQVFYPARPTRLKAHQQSDGSILLSWKASPTKPLAGYNVYYHVVGHNGYFRVNIQPVSETRYTVSGLPPGHYSFFVRAFQTSHNPPTEGPNSNEVMVNTGAISKSQ